MITKTYDIAYNTVAKLTPSVEETKVWYFYSKGCMPHFIYLNSEFPQVHYYSPFKKLQIDDKSYWIDFEYKKKYANKRIYLLVNRKWRWV